jgi:hypothetical protein
MKSIRQHPGNWGATTSANLAHSIEVMRGRDFNSAA